MTNRMSWTYLAANILKVDIDAIWAELLQAGGEVL